MYTNLFIKKCKDDHDDMMSTIVLSTAGLRKSVLPAMRKHRHGRDDRRKKVHRVFREKIQPKVTYIYIIMSSQSPKTLVNYYDCA